MSSAINGYFTAVRRVYKNAIAKFFEEIIKIVCAVILLHIYDPSNLNDACFSLILADVISEYSSFAFIILLYIKDLKRESIESRYSDLESYSKRILRITIPVALTSYLRSGLSTLKQLIIPSSLQKSGMNSSGALSSYGIVNGMAMPIIMFPVILVTSISGLLIPEFSRYHALGKKKKIKNTSIFILTRYFYFFFNDMYFYAYFC